MRLACLISALFFFTTSYAKNPVPCGANIKVVLKALDEKASSTRMCSDKDNLEVIYTNAKYVLYPGIAGSSCTIYFEKGRLTQTNGCNEDVIKHCEPSFSVSCY